MTQLSSAIRVWLKDLQDKRAQFAECAQKPGQGNSANCANSARRQAQSIPPSPTTPPYTPEERTLLEPAPHELRQTVAQIKGIFGDICTPTVTDVQVVPHKPRCQAARLIRSARREGHHDQAIALRDAWRERIAFCTVDGGMVQEAAERVAASELEGLCTNSHTHDENYFGL